jgi:hypothetical protein
MQLFDGHDRSAQIDGARAVPPLSVALCLTSGGPSSCHFIFPSAFPLPPCVIHSLLLFGPRGSPFFSPSTHCLPCAPFLSTSVSNPKARSFLPSSPHLPGIFRHGSSSVTPLRHHSHFSPLLPHASPMSSLLPYTMSSALALRSDPQAIQLFQVSAREVFPIPRC